MAQVTIIVVNHNGTFLLEDCLTSINNQTYTDYEVLLVDNGSTDDSIRSASRILPKIHVMSLCENTGWAKANNLGIRNTDSQFIVLLNNDTRADPNFLLELVRIVEGNPSVGMVAPKILNFYNPELIDSVGGLVICRDGIAQGKGRGEIDIGQYDQLQEALIPSGCAALYRKTMFDEIGLFDESFFAYCEDSDLALRGLWAGWLAVAAPRAIVYHKYSATSGGYSPAKLYLVERNHFYVAVRNFPLRMILLLPLWTVYRFALMIIAIIAYRGKSVALQGGRWPDLLAALLRAQFHAVIRAWPKLLQRAAIRRISSKQFTQKIKAYRLSMRRMVFNR